MSSERNFRSLYIGKSITSTSAGDSADLIYTVPDNHDMEVTLILAANESNSSDKLTLQIYHKHQSSWFDLIKNESVSGNGHINLLNGSRIYLHAGDKIAGYVTTNNDAFNISVSGMLFYNPGAR